MPPHENAQAALNEWLTNGTEMAEGLTISDAFLAGWEAARRNACMVCGKLAPSGWFRIVDNDDEAVGLVCSNHSLWDLARSDKFMIRIEAVSDE